LIDSKDNIETKVDQRLKYIDKITFAFSIFQK